MTALRRMQRFDLIDGEVDDGVDDVDDERGNDEGGEHARADGRLGLSPPPSLGGSAMDRFCPWFPGQIAGGDNAGQRAVAPQLRSQASETNYEHCSCGNLGC